MPESLTWDILATGHVNHINDQVGYFRAKGGGKVVTRGFDEDDVQSRKPAAETEYGFQVDGGVLADKQAPVSTSTMSSEPAHGRAPKSPYLSLRQDSHK